MGDYKIIIRANGRWYDKLTGKPFVGTARVKGLTYRYTSDGQKILETKDKPDLDKVQRNLWSFENPQHLGFRNGLYFPYKTANGNIDIGPGIDWTKQTGQFRDKAKKGLTPQQINSVVKQKLNKHLSRVNAALGDYTAFPDTVSPQIKEGLIDMRYQTGSLQKFPKLLNAVAKGDQETIKAESKTYFRDGKTGAKTFDKKRHDERLRHYFHYGTGGSLAPKARLRLIPRTRKTGSRA